MLAIDKIYNEDCLEGMKRIADGSVDFVCTDLPFGITSNDWDVKLDLTKFWEQINRVTKLGAAVALFANGKYLFELGASNIKDYRYKIVVEKDAASGFLNAHKMPLKAHDDILIFYRKLPTYNPQHFYSYPIKFTPAVSKSLNYRDGYDHRTIYASRDGKRYPRDCVKFNYPKSGFIKNTDKTEHPTQKPVELIEYLIKTYTNEGETVLDATIGSGTTAVAAINTNRHFIGFETEKKFFDIANERILKAYAEKSQQLFN